MELLKIQLPRRPSFWMAMLCLSAGIAGIGMFMVGAMAFSVASNPASAAELLEPKLAAFVASVGVMAVAGSIGTYKQARWMLDVMRKAEA